MTKTKNNVKERKRPMTFQKLYNYRFLVLPIALMALSISVFYSLIKFGNTDIDLIATACIIFILGTILLVFIISWLRRIKQ